MSTAYLGPFEFIVDLAKPASGFVALVPEFDVTNVTSSAVFNSPDPEGIGYEYVYQYDGEVYIWDMPDLATLSTTQKYNLMSTLCFTSGSGWRMKTAGPYFATRELAMADALSLPTSAFQRRSYVTDCSLVIHAITRVISSPFSQTFLRAYHELTNFPFGAYMRNQGDVDTNAGAYNFVDTGILLIQPAALVPEVFPSEYTLDESSALMLISGKSKTYAPGGVITPPPIQVETVVSIPGPVSGESKYNTNRGPALALEGTIDYPGYVTVLIAEFGSGAYTATPIGGGFPDDERWDGTTYIYKVPAITSFTDREKYVLARPLVYSSVGGGWEAMNVDYDPVTRYFGSQEEALAFALGVPPDMVERRASVGSCFVRQRGIVVGAQYQRNYVDCGNLPLWSAKFNPFLRMSLDYRVNTSPFSWISPNHVNASPSALNTLLINALNNGDDGPFNPYYYEAPVMDDYDNDTALLTISVFTDLYGFYNPPGNAPAESVSVSGTVSVPGTVSGETIFNAQRTGALSYAGTLSYP